MTSPYWLVDASTGGYVNSRSYLGACQQYGFGLRGCFCGCGPPALLLVLSTWIAIKNRCKLCCCNLYTFLKEKEAREEGTSMERPLEVLE